MSDIHLPALRGDQAAPFLAALGVLSLTSHDLGDNEATLCWSNGPRAGALLGTSVAGDVDGLANRLTGIARTMVDSDELLPAVGRGFPPRKEGKETDPTRAIDVNAAAAWGVRARHNANTSESGWLASIFAINDLVTTNAGSVIGRNAVFDAGPGTVSMSKTLADLRNRAAADGVATSLTVGRRVAGLIAGYVDWRADRDAADARFKKDPMTNYGDPALAWLAFMGLRCAPVIAVRGQAVSALTPAVRNRHFRKPLVWPVWSSRLDLAAVATVLSHRAVHSVVEAVDPSDMPDRSTRRASPIAAHDLDALGVVAVYAASRLSKGNNDGAYGPALRTWSAET